MITPLLLLGSSLVLGGLAPAKVSNVTTNSNAAPAPQPPYVIYVDSFSVDQTASQSPNDDGDSSGGRPHILGMFRGGEQNTLIGQRKEQQYQDTLQKLPGILQKALIENLGKSIARATDGDGVRATRWDCWVVTGQFIVVDAGDRAMQAGIGFGAGQSQIEVQAQVYALRDMNNPFLVFNSKGASGHMPGAVMMMNPYVAAAKFVMSKKEPEKESKKIAKAIAQEIGKFMTAQGIPTLQVMKENGQTPPAPAPANPSSKSTNYYSNP